MKKTLSLAALSLALLASHPLAGAAEYKSLVLAKSQIRFTYKQMGVPVDGQFRKFQSQISFDPAKAANAKVSFEIDLASIDAGSSEANQEVAGKQWFNTKAFPSAQFVADSVKALDGNRYEVGGKLTLKGRTQPLRTVATLTPAEGGARFEGQLSLKRGDFAIGEGPWADYATVANEVLIRFNLLVTP